MRSIKSDARNSNDLEGLGIFASQIINIGMKQKSSLNIQISNQLKTHIP